MHNNAKIASVTASPVLPAAATASTAGGDSHDSRPSQDADRNARYRLVIEEGPHAGTFIYKTLDRVTGEIVKQLPREQIVNLMQAQDYSSGSVIDTKA